MKLIVALLLLVSLMKAQAVGQTKKLNGVHVKAVAMELSLTFSVKRDASGKITEFGGPTYELLDWLSKQLNFTYEILVPAESVIYGPMLPNGSYPGLLGYLQRKESEIALSAFGFVTQASFIERSFPWHYVDFSILIPYPEEQNKAWAAFLPFQLHVWIALLLSSILTAVSMVLLTYSTRSGGRGSGSLGSSVSYLLGVATAQGGYLAHKGRRLIIIASAWCLCAFVLVSAYSGLLISFLSTTRLLPVVDSLHQLAEKLPKGNIYVLKGSYPDVAFLEATGGDLKALGDYFGANPEKRTLTIPLCLESAYKNNGMCIVGTPLVASYLEQLIRKTGKCTMSRSTESFLAMPTFLFIRRDLPHHRILNEQIIWALETGLMRRWMQEAYAPSGKCRERKTTPANNSPLYLKDLMSAFVLLAIGTSLSLIAFVLENIRYVLRGATVPVK